LKSEFNAFATRPSSASLDDELCKFMPDLHDQDTVIISTSNFRL